MKNSYLQYVFFLILFVYSVAFAANDSQTSNTSARGELEIQLVIPERLTAFTESNQHSKTLETNIVFSFVEGNEISQSICIALSDSSTYTTTFKGSGKDGDFALANLQSYTVIYDDGSGESTVTAGKTQLHQVGTKQSNECKGAGQGRIRISLNNNQQASSNTENLAGTLTLLLTTI